MNNSKAVIGEIDFFSLLVSGVLGIVVLGLLLFLLPKGYNAAPALCIGWGTFLAMSLYLGKAFEKMVWNPAHIGLAVMSAQLFLLGLLTPWLGLTNDAVNAWFGRVFFVLYFIGVLLTGILGNLFHRWRKANSSMTDTDSEQS